MSFFILFLMTFASGFILLFISLHTIYFFRAIFSRIRNRGRPGDYNGSLPMVTVLIPARNEEKVLTGLFESLHKLNYPLPKLEIIIIDDFSRDKTSEIIKNYKHYFPYLRSIHLKPPLAHKGKSYALNRGLKRALGKFVIVYDADNEPEPDSLRKLVIPAIRNKKLAAVFGSHKINNFAANIFTRFIELEIYFHQFVLGEGRGELFNLFLSPGTNCLYRSSALKEVGGWDNDSLTEDTEISLNFYRRGWDMLYCPLAVSWEQEPESLFTWLRQRTRWFRGNLYTAFKYLKKSFQLPVKVTLFVIIYQFILYTILIWSLLISLMISSGHFVSLIGNFINISALQVIDTRIYLIIWIIAALSFYLQVIVSKYIMTGKITMYNLITAFLFYLFYAPLWVVVVLKGYFSIIVDTIKRQEAKWAKTERF